jgi:hypothetical protein
MKGIIVVDMPERCNQCKFWFAKATVPIEYRCMGLQKEITEKNLTEEKPDWCPRTGGWNASIDEILGKE